MISIVTVGPQCTGKSTLIKELKKAYPDFMYQKEFVRAILPKDKVNRAELETQKIILDTQVKFLKKNANLISDRSPLDSYCYTYVLKSQGLSDISDEDMKKLEEESKRALQEDVDVIFFLPIEFPLTDDGYRTMDEEQRAQVEDVMLDHIAKWGLTSKVKFIRGDIDSRVMYCRGIIDGYLLRDNK